MATVCPVVVSRARKTWAMPPCPTSWSISWRSSISVPVVSDTLMSPAGHGAVAGELGVGLLRSCVAHGAHRVTPVGCATGVRSNANDRSR